ncbi:hypothetical protein [Sunxiuqinia elliptica]|uniref:Type IX secretion system membrane protein PorP/SprF n=1 Tax=Sunxiuqinia elliptica TaxID=655355 RepID=A0A1I2HJ75_9BACT|nr:hypothetical protein [Sunxiuqinia elliptica]SFF29752.1 hypothetical protein SAMN05216283_104118 [Sunxiuqinia elliptica]
MRFTRFILAFIVLLGMLDDATSQTFGDIQTYSTPILLNSSYSGATRGDRLMVSLVGTRRKDTQSYMRFISHDFFRKKRSLGLSYIGGIDMDYTQNIYAPFFRLAAAKYYPKENKRYIIPSIMLGMQQPSKEFSLFIFDRFLGPGDHPDNNAPPGFSLYRTTEVVGGAGILFANFDGSVGLTANFRRSYKKKPYTDEFDASSYQVLIHAEKIFNYYKRDLLTKKYLIRPRAIAHLSDSTMQFFGEVMVQRKQFEIGLGSVYNIDTNNYRVSLNLGYDFKYFKLHYLGSVLSQSGDWIYPMHNLSISVVFPELKRYGIPVPPLIRNL